VYGNKKEKNKQRRSTVMGSRFGVNFRVGMAFVPRHLFNIYFLFTSLILGQSPESSPKNAPFLDDARPSPHTSNDYNKMSTWLNWQLFICKSPTECRHK
jgi:hypothetical protein